MKKSLKILKLGIYVFALPLVATAAASAHQWMTSNTVLSVVPPVPAAVSNTSVARINAVRNHTITLNDAGEVQGRVASINHKTKIPFGLSNVTIYFAQNGRIVRKGYTNDDGTFVVKGLKEGVYSFVAGGEHSFATCGVSVVQATDEVENFIEVALISPNAKAVRELIENELPESVKSDLKKKSTAEPKNIAGSNRVELDGDKLKGRIVSLVSEKLSGDTKAHLFNGTTKVADFTVGSDGTFEVADVNPGVYDIVVVGVDGVAAVSFEAVAPVDEDSTEAYTALQDSIFSNFIVALAPQFDGGCVGCGGSDAIVYDSPVQVVGNDLGGGIAGGGCCGGADNFSGFGGGCCGGGGAAIGGRRLLLPLLAAAIAIPLAVGGGGGPDDQSPSDTQ